MEPIHKSVLLKEVLDFLKIEPGAKYVDATLGQAGHSLEIARMGGLVLGIEANPQTLSWAEGYLNTLKDPELTNRIKSVRGNFRDLARIAAGSGFNGAHGVLFDLGLSTFELKESGLGLSFLKDEPLDMRFDPESQEVTAAGLINSLDKGELYGIFIKFGEERDAERIVSAIVRGRRIKKIETSCDLVALIDSAYQPKLPGHGLTGHLAKVFQALRIAVNEELESLKDALPQAFEVLQSGGRVCVISFHSLEDRIVKETFNRWAEEGLGTVLSKRPVAAGEKELKENRSGRSAKLRMFEKL